MGYTTTPLTIVDKKLLRGEIPTEQDYKESHKQIMEHCRKEIEENQNKIFALKFLFGILLLIIVAFIIKSI